MHLRADENMVCLSFLMGNHYFQPHLGILYVLYVYCAQLKGETKIETKLKTIIRIESGHIWPHSFDYTYACVLVYNMNQHLYEN